MDEDPVVKRILDAMAIPLRADGCLATMPDMAILRALQIGCVFLPLWMSTVFADSSTLDMLYVDEIPSHTLQLTRQAATQVINGEEENARLSLEHLHAYQEEVPDPIIRARLLMNYGAILVALGDSQAGTLALHEGIEIMESLQSALSAELTKGLISLGVGELSLGLIQEGEATLLRAQNLIHRENGVYAADQEIILYHLTTTALDQGDFANADRLQRFSLMVAERSYGEDSPELVPSLKRLGSYFASRGSMLPMVSLGALRPQHGFLGATLCTDGPRFRPRPCNPGIEKWQAAQLEQSRAAAKLHIEREALFKESIENYGRAARIQEQHSGDTENHSFDTLRMMAWVYLQQGDYRDAERVLRRAVEQAEGGTTVDLEDRIEITLDLGDLLTVRTDTRASEVYLTAWHLMQAKGLNDEVYFNKPYRLVPGSYQSLALDAASVTDEEVDEYFALVEYDVSKKGRVEDIRVLDSNVPGPQVRSLRSELLKSRFRPRIEGGELVDTTDIQIRFTYPVPG